MPMGVSVVMNVNTMVEILIHYLESGDWRECFQRAVPQRKVNAKPNLQEAFHFRRVVTEEQLLALTPVQLPKFEFKNALDTASEVDFREGGDEGGWKGTLRCEGVD